jgi:peptide/nickel transport system ATP-binding protein
VTASTDAAATSAGEELQPLLEVRGVRASYYSDRRRRKRFTERVEDGAATSTVAGATGTPSASAGKGSASPSRAFELRDVSVIVPRGACVGLVGESGSGKTTLGNCVAGLLPVIAGEIRYNGAIVSSPVQKPKLPRVHGVQVVYQDPYSALNPRRSVGSILREILLVHKLCSRSEVRMRCEGLLAQVGLDPRVLASRPRALSGGMCQRVAIARALAFEPELLIADEVVSSLDASIQAQVLNLLTDLREAMGLSVLFISHDLAVVNQLCDTVAVMYRGRVVEVGRTESVLQAPRDDYTRRLLKAIPRISTTMLPSQPRKPGS